MEQPKLQLVYAMPKLPTALQCFKRRSLFSEITHRRTDTYGSQAVSSSHRTTATCCKFGIYQIGQGKTTHGIFHMVHRPDRRNLVVRTRMHTAWTSSERKAAPLERPVRHFPKHRRLHLPWLKKTARTVRVKEKIKLRRRHIVTSSIYLWTFHDQHVGHIYPSLTRARQESHSPTFRKHATSITNNHHDVLIFFVFRKCVRTCFALFVPPKMLWAFYVWVSARRCKYKVSSHIRQSWVARSTLSWQISQIDLTEQTVLSNFHP